MHRLLQPYPWTFDQASWRRGMHENQDNNKQATGQGSRQDTRGYREQRSMDRWQYRADQVQLRQQQVQSEMSTSVQVVAIVVAVFWNYTPHPLMLGWAFAVVATAGIRSLFISASNSLVWRAGVTSAYSRSYTATCCTRYLPWPYSSACA